MALLCCPLSCEFFSLISAYPEKQPLALEWRGPGEGDIYRGGYTKKIPTKYKILFSSQTYKLYYQATCGNRRKNDKSLAPN